MEKYPIFSSEQLKSADKILFFIPIAIGDFTYMQNFFRAFKAQYPHLKIHLWVDDVRRTWCFWKWKNYKNYVLYDWVESCGLFDKIYRESYSWPLFFKSIRQARQENYPLVCMLGTLRNHRYAKYLRLIAPNGFIASLVNERKNKWGYRYFNGKLPYTARTDDKTLHISQIYAGWFERMFGVVVSERDRFPYIAIPHDWQLYGKLKLMAWGITEKNKAEKPIIFVNCFAKIHKRCWPLHKVIALIHALKEDQRFAQALFVVNTLPEAYAATERVIIKSKLTDVQLFTANENFFQLPSMISAADLVISVDTSVVHLATALKRPLVVLIRSKQTAWIPQDKERTAIVLAPDAARVYSIPLEQVVKTTHELAQQYIP